MTAGRYYAEQVETLGRSDLNALIDERVRYTIRYANEHSPFYRHWLKENRIDYTDIRGHEDLLHLPICSGKTIREHQPPVTSDFRFLSADLHDIFTIHETSGTSGTPKSFFLTWEDWKRYAEKYARSFVSQGFGPGDRVVVCASYGMNVGANTMTLAAKNIGMTVIPIGKCDFATRVLSSYRPTAIVGSVFKLLRLARKIALEGLRPQDTSVERLVAGGESFADESRAYLAQLWGRPVFNTYGSTEGTMCGECTASSGLHVPEDLVHLDIYDPQMKAFVPDGECGRGVLTTLLPVGGKAGTLLINYDTEDTTVVLSRERCACGRTHMRIINPAREAETFWALGTAINRIDVEAAVFQVESMQDLTGEYEAFLYDGKSRGDVVMRVGLECSGPAPTDRRDIEDRFVARFLKYKRDLARHYEDGTFAITFTFAGPSGLELHTLKGRPKRLIDRRPG